MTLVVVFTLVPFAFASIVGDQSTSKIAGALFAAALLGAAAVAWAIHRRPLPPQGSDGLQIIAVPVYQVAIFGAALVLDQGWLWYTRNHRGSNA